MQQLQGAAAPESRRLLRILLLRLGEVSADAGAVGKPLKKRLGVRLLSF
jgi:hypothetical protein